MDGQCCKDDRFEILERVTEHLLEATNIKRDSDEWKQLDTILFRLWQIGEIGAFTNKELQDLSASYKAAAKKLNAETLKLKYNLWMNKSIHLREMSDEYLALYKLHCNDDTWKKWLKKRYQCLRIANDLEHRAYKLSRSIADA